MRLPVIEKKAQALNIKDTRRYTKPELIKMIQQTEGNTPCFGTPKRNSDCPQMACCWRPDCIKK